MAGEVALQASSLGSVDPVVLLAAAVTAFFAVLAIVFLARYRQLSARISASSDLGKELWDSLEARLKVQDERILDVMTRLEVIQARTIERARQAGFPPAPRETYSTLSQMPTLTEAPRPAQIQPMMEQPTPVRARVKKRGGPDSAEMKALRFLSEGPRTSVEIMNLTDLSREHAARVMKDLFDRALVVRDDSHKPFVYQITEAGKSYLSSG
jgi:predicted HTH transcriptional regulator